MKKLILAILLSIISGCAWAQTIPNASPLYNSYSCNSSTTQWPYAFYINSTSDMVVQLTDSSGNITYPANFSVDTTNVWVNYPLVGTCPTGDTVTLYASTPITQTTSYGQRNPFTATAVGSSFNKLTIISQQLQRQLNNTFTVPTGQTAGAFPSSSPGNYIGWNNSGVLANIPSPANAALWSLSGANAYYTLGNVGVGLTNPGQALDVTGTVRATSFSGPLTGNASTATSATTAGTVTTAAQPTITSVGTLTGLITSGNVGIGSATPGFALDVQGTVRATGFTWGSPTTTGLALATPYLATSDGLVFVSGTNSDSINHTLNIWVGPDNPPTSDTQYVLGVMLASNAGSASGTVKVKKGQYYEATSSGTGGSVNSMEFWTL